MEKTMDYSNEKRMKKVLVMGMAALGMMTAGTAWAAEADVVPTPAATVATVPAPAVPAAAKTTAGYTGLIVDCTGLGLKPVMSPVIRVVEGSPIYGDKDLNYDLVASKGMAGYTTELHSAARAGANPLIVKAVSVLNHSGDPVLSVEDAKRVVDENSKANFLKQLNVVFVR
mgnify:CR=1 FL=1|jgi:hypothetical protein